jgi:hypothetical protein
MRYCDVCGGLVSTFDEPPGSGGEDVGLLCEVCIRTRRVLPDTGAAKAERKHLNRFRCPHCDRRLRCKPVRARVEIACPKCKGELVLLPGGGIEAGGERAAPEPLDDDTVPIPIDVPAREPAARAAAAVLSAEPAAEPEAEAEPDPAESRDSDGEEETEEEEAPGSLEESADPADDDEPDSADDPPDSEENAFSSDDDAFEVAMKQRDLAAAEAELAALADDSPQPDSSPASGPEEDAAGPAPVRTSRALLSAALAIILGGLGGAYAARGAAAPPQLAALGERVGAGFGALEARAAALLARPD